jgi:hypothetical protein
MPRGQEIFTKDSLIRKLGEIAAMGFVPIGYPHHSSEASGLVSSTFPTMVAYVAGPTATAC